MFIFSKIAKYLRAFFRRSPFPETTKEYEVFEKVMRRIAEDERKKGMDYIINKNNIMVQFIITKRKSPFVGDDDCKYAEKFLRENHIPSPERYFF